MLEMRVSCFAQSVFDTFPWPQFSSPGRRRGDETLTASGKEESGTPHVVSYSQIKQIDAVAAAAREMRRVRAEALRHLKGGLRALYRTLELPGANPLKEAHAALNTAVFAVYGFSAKKDLLAQLLALNLEVAARIERNEPASAPGIPTGYLEPQRLVAEDCIRLRSASRALHSAGLNTGAPRRCCFAP